MENIAIAIRDSDLYLLATVVRSNAGDIYVNWPRDHLPSWQPHTSYHASGQHHQKSFGKALGIRKAAKPDASFEGTKQVVSFGVAAGDQRGSEQPDPRQFTSVFEIPASLLKPEKYSTWVYVDLVEPNISPVLFPGAAVLKQQTYTDAMPWLVLTFLELPQEFCPPSAA